MPTECASSLQLWPDGAQVQYRGNPFGDWRLLQVKFHDKDKDFRVATPDEARAVRIEVRAERYAEQDVLCVDSSLVGDLLKDCDYAESDVGLAFTWEEVKNLYPDPSEWDLATCKEWLDDHGVNLPDPNPWAMERQQMLDLIDAADAADGRDLGPMTDDEVRAVLIDDIDESDGDELAPWRQAVRDNAEAAEVFEWWRVTAWLANELAEVGEVVLDNDYGEWWGRCCTGQGYIMDGVFQKIAARHETVDAGK
jgi:hypothetical protein